jgi:hypothetical protein
MRSLSHVLKSAEHPGRKRHIVEQEWGHVHIFMEWLEAHLLREHERREKSCIKIPQNSIAQHVLIRHGSIYISE